jgi:hypothetical protein
MENVIGKTTQRLRRACRGGRPMLHNVAARWDIGAYVLIGRGHI